MQETETDPTSPGRSPTPNPALKQLDKLVGTWNLKGREYGTNKEVTGQVAFEWLEGGFFLVQHIDVRRGDSRRKGIEIIGYEQRWGPDAPDQECTSHYFDNLGNAFTYTYEVGDVTFIIKGGEHGPQAAFKGKFSDDHDIITGRWRWPGGGYEVTMTRVM